MVTRQVNRKTRNQRVRAFERILRTARENGLVTASESGSVITLVHPDVQEARGIRPEQLTSLTVEVDPEFPEMLRQLRHDAGLTQRELCESVSISMSYISKMENGGLEPSEDVLQGVASVLAERLCVDDVALLDEMLMKLGKVPSDISARLLDRPDLMRSLREEIEDE